MTKGMAANLVNLSSRVSHLGIQTVSAMLFQPNTQGPAVFFRILTSLHILCASWASPILLFAWQALYWLNSMSGPWKPVWILSNYSFLLVSSELIQSEYWKKLRFEGDPSGEYKGTERVVGAADVEVRMSNDILHCLLMKVFQFIYFMCIGVLSACVMPVWGWQILEFQTGVSYLVGAGIWTWALWKSRQCSLNHAEPSLQPHKLAFMLVVYGFNSVYEMLTT